VSFIALVADPKGPSSVGGSPRLPRDFEWPTHSWPLTEVKGWPDFARAEVDKAITKKEARKEGGRLVMPIAYACTIDLADVKDDRLPKRGSLVFFASQTTNIEDERYGKRVACAVRFIPPNTNIVPTTPPPSPDPSPKGEVHLRARRVKKFDEETHVVFPPTMNEAMGPMPPKGETAILRLCEERDIAFYIGDASWITFTVPTRDLAKAKFDDARASVFIG
jgi:hypothetical protein